MFRLASVAMNGLTPISTLPMPPRALTPPSTAAARLSSISDSPVLACPDPISAVSKRPVTDPSNELSI
jgi:hypothetical protein